MGLRTARHWVLGCLFGAALAACGPSLVTPPDTRDAQADGAAADTPLAPTDAGLRVDVTTTRDAAPRDDAPTPDDAGSGDDAPTADDVPATRDVGPVDDVASATDLGPALDAPAVTDAGPAVDLPSPVDLGPPLDGGAAACAIVRALNPSGDSVMGTLAGPSRNAMTSCAAAGGPEQYYSLRLGARTGLVFDTTAALDTVLAVRTRCDQVSGELACNDDVPGSNNAFVRRVFEPGEYVVLVDQFNANGTGGAYSLRVAPYAPAANSACAAASPLAPGVMTVGNTATGGAASTACLNDAWGPQLFYTLQVPAGRRATVTATPNSTPASTPVLRLLDGCSATRCLGGAAAPMPGAAASLTVDNRTDQPRSYVVSLASQSGRATGSFAVTAALSDAPPAAPNAACSRAIAVAGGSALSAQDASLSSTGLAGACLPNALGSVLFYRVSLAPRSTTLLTVTPTGPAWDPTLRVLSGCNTLLCNSTVDARGAGQPEEYVVTNAASTPSEALIAVGGTGGAGSGRFDLAVQSVAQTGGAQCGGAQAVSFDPSGRAELRLQNASVASENATAYCLPSATGAVLWYTVAVPGRSSLAISAAPRTAGVDPVVRVVPGCGTNRCLVQRDEGAAGANEHARFVNADPNPVNVWVAVGGETNASNGVFDLRMSLERGYLESAVPAACDDLSQSAFFSQVTGDDTVSPVLDLPFGFDFMGERMLEYSASSNGLLQLFPRVQGAVPSNAYQNVALPTLAAPNGLVAAFWDDLTVEPGGGVRSRTFGTAPSRRFTVEWSDFSVLSDRASRLTFQVKLFETTGVVEIHHCALRPGQNMGLATGGSATVGIENGAGTDGRQHSLDTPGSVSAGAAIRYTP